MPDEATLQLARQWLAKARSDLLDVDNNLKAKEIPFDMVCFHCQQAAEKLLKAFLVGNGESFPYTHDLMLLLEHILPLEPDSESLRDTLALLLPYAVEVRYPDEGGNPTEQDAKEAREAAGKILSWLERVLSDIF